MKDGTADISDDAARNKVWEMIKDIRIAQLVTHAQDGMLHARPMAALNKGFDGKLWFYTVESAPKITEIQINPRVLLAYSDPSKQAYISVQGMAEVTNDRRLIDEFWIEAARMWFPKGKDDPTIRLLSVDVVSAEYWDSASNTFSMLYSYTVARLTGQTPDMGENRKVAF